MKNPKENIHETLEYRNISVNIDGHAPRSLRPTHTADDYPDRRGAEGSHQNREVPKEVIKTVEVEKPTEAPAAGESLPRNETLYFNGQQWGPVKCWNPYSVDCNNALAINEKDAARVIMWETPYLFDMLDGKSYPLLADGDFTWNDARTEITFKLKPAAKWSDGTPMTADDVAYTWATQRQVRDECRQ